MSALPDLCFKFDFYYFFYFEFLFILYFDELLNEIKIFLNQDFDSRS